VANGEITKIVRFSYKEYLTSKPTKEKALEASLGTTVADLSQ
jgi:hypothetical protein